MPSKTSKKGSKKWYEKLINVIKEVIHLNLDAVQQIQKEGDYTCYSNDIVNEKVMELKTSKR